MNGINWNELLQGLLSSIIIAAVPVITAAALLALQRLKEYLEAKKDESWFAKAGWMVADAVYATSQILGDELKDAARDGKLTEEEKSRLFQHAKDLAIKNIGSVPAKLLPAFESWVRAKIEAELAKLKILQKVGPASLPPVGGQGAEPSKVR